MTREIYLGEDTAKRIRARQCPYICYQARRAGERRSTPEATPLSAAIRKSDGLASSWRYVYLKRCYIAELYFRFVYEISREWNEAGRTDCWDSSRAR